MKIMKSFTKFGSAIFGLIALLHVLRLVRGWEAEIGGLVIPLWVSGLAVVLSALMSWGLWKESQR